MAAVVGVPPLTAIPNDDCWFIIVLPMNAAISHPDPCGAILNLMVSCNHVGYLFLGQEPVDSDGFGNSVQSTTPLNDGRLVGYGHLTDEEVCMVTKPASGEGPEQAVECCKATEVMLV
jgi:hypothetical protein